MGPQQRKGKLQQTRRGLRAGGPGVSGPLALTLPDIEHSQSEVRWVTLGKDAADQYVPVVHTYEQAGDHIGRIRLISARRPTKAEVPMYEEER